MSIRERNCNVKVENEEHRVGVNGIITTYVVISSCVTAKI